MQIHAIALENIVFFHFDEHVQITRWCAVCACFAFATQANAAASVHACGHVHFQSAARAHFAVAFTFHTWVFDFHARALAGWTGLLYLENRLAYVYGATAMTGVTRHRLRTCFRARTMAHITLFIGGKSDFLFHAMRSFFQRNRQIVAQIRTLVIGLARTTTAATCTTKHLAENIVDVEICAATKATAESATTAHIGVNTGMTVLVVSGFFLRGGQDIVSFLNFFEFFFGFFIVWIAVRMVFHRQFAIGFFDFSFAGAFGYP